RSRAHVLDRIERVAHAEALNGSGHELHQAESALWRARERIETRFDLYNRSDELGAQAVQVRVLGNERFIGPALLDRHESRDADICGLRHGVRPRLAALWAVGKDHVPVSVTPGIDLRP